MMPEEKEQLLVLLQRESQWCRDAEARDASGAAVTYDDGSAVAWDLTGALCRLFGWERARVLFGQFHRQLHGKRRAFGWPRGHPELDAMVALQEYNDDVDTTFPLLRTLVEQMPVWQHGAAGRQPAESED